MGDSAVPQDAFADIDRFDTESAVLALGNAVNRAGRQMFAEIGAVVKSIDSVAKTQPKQYDENVSKTNEQEVQDHGYDESERVSGAQDGNEGSAQTAGRGESVCSGRSSCQDHSLLYDKMLLDGTLYSDLKQTEQRYWEQVEQTITKLLVSNPAPDKNDDPLGWTAHMNSLQAQAAELAMPIVTSL